VGRMINWARGSPTTTAAPSAPLLVLMAAAA
jgi:hypothetical protein